MEGDEGGRWGVKERVGADECWDWGRSVLSCASSNVSPSLSELSALEDMGRLSAIMVRWLGYSQRCAVQVGFGSLCNWALLLGCACPRKGAIGGSDGAVVIRTWNGGN